MQADHFFIPKAPCVTMQAVPYFYIPKSLKQVFPFISAYCTVRIEVVKILSGAGNIVAAERKEWLSFLMNACVNGAEQQ